MPLLQGGVKLRRLPAAALAACVLALALPAASPAATNAEVSLMDDQLLLGKSQSHINRQMRLFRRLGVDRLRLSAFWKASTSPIAGHASKPAGFNGANHRSPGYAFGELDKVVFSARAHGLRVMLSVSTPGPRWAAGGSGVALTRIGEFAAYARAVATRYRSAVDHYGLSNEPNQRSWLDPQTDGSGLVSPHVYRAMVRSAYPQIKAGDPGSVVLVGNLASSGNDGSAKSRGIRPLEFLRAMACVDSSYRPISSGRCANFQPVPADAIAHHPYKFFGPPNRRSAKRDDAAIGDGRRLLRVLDRLTRAGRLFRPSVGGRLSVFYTEFGYQTDPPDPFAGISLRNQNRFLQRAAYQVWATPRLRGLNQFRLTDGPLRPGPGLRRYAEFQSGLLFANRRRKPSYRFFANPFVISGSRFWGQVRPGRRHLVSIQHRSSRAGRFRTIRRVRTNRAGYFRVRLRRRSGQWRFRSTRGSSQTLSLR